MYTAWCNVPQEEERTHVGVLTKEIVYCYRIVQGSYTSENDFLVRTLPQRIKNCFKACDLTLR